MFSTTIILLSRLLFTRAARSMVGAARLRSVSDRLRRCATFVSTVASAAAEGLQKAEQYRTLAHDRNAERGMPRVELLRAIMLTKH